MKIKLKGNWQTRQIWLNGEYLSPQKSQAKVNHSPDGFNWGYGGSGPAQLALAICMKLYGNDCYKWIDVDYQQFKFDFISTLPKSDFDVELEVPDIKIHHLIT